MGSRDTCGQTREEGPGASLRGNALGLKCRTLASVRAGTHQLRAPPSGGAQELALRLGQCLGFPASPCRHPQPLLRGTRFWEAERQQLQLSPERVEGTDPLQLLAVL